MDVDDERVLRFMITYQAEHGYLPTLTEIASGCAFRSRGAVRRIVAEFEAVGLVERDPAYPRLGVVRMPVEMVRQAERVRLSPTEELWMCEFSVRESRGAMRALRLGMDLAPDLDAMDFLLRKSQERVALVRAYEQARARLVGSGVELDAEARRLLAAADADIARRHAMVTDFRSYCLYSLLMNISAQRALDDFAAKVHMSYLAPIFLSERHVFCGTRLDEDVTRATWSNHAVLEASAFPIASWITELRQRLCDRLPSTLQDGLDEAETHALVAEIHV